MEEIKKVIQAMVISNANKSLTVAQLNKDFKCYEGYDIPYQEFGFKQLDAMLRTMPDTVQLDGHGPFALVLPVTTKKSQHIQAMVGQQKRSVMKRNVSSSKNKGYGYRTTQHANYNYRSLPYYSSNEEISDNIYNQKGLSYPERISYYAGSFLMDADQQPFHVENIVGNDLQSENNSSNSMNPQGSRTPQTKSVGCSNQVIKNDENQSLKQHRERGAMNRLVNRLLIMSPRIPSDALKTADKLPEHIIPSYVKPGSLLKVIVVSVLTPADVYVHLMCHTEELEKVAVNIESIYGEMCHSLNWQLDEAMAKEGLYCVVKHQNYWYRGMIAGPVVDRRVTLLLVDYGYQLNVGLSDIRYMSKKLATLPPQYVRVSLAHVKPSTELWSEDATRYLSEISYNNVLHMYCVETNRQNHTLDVVFIDTNTPADVILNSQLVLKNYAKWVHAV